MYINLDKNQDGVASNMVIVSVVVVALVIFIGYLIYNSPTKVKPASTTAAITTTPATSTTTSTSTSSSSSNASVSSLQAQLNTITAADGSNTADLNSANSGLSDQSTFTAY